MLELNSVSGGYIPGINVINDITVAFEEESISGIIGPNGAGKSTLIKIIYGFAPVRTGKIYHHGTEIIDVPPKDMLPKANIAYIPQERSVFPELTVQQNLRLGGWTIRKDKPRVTKALNRVYQDFPVLEEKKDQWANELSGGQQRMIEIARSLITDPKTVLIDEPTAGLSPSFVSTVYDAIRQLKQSGVTVVLVEQNIQAAIEYGDYLFIIENGELTARGETSHMEGNVGEIVRDWISVRNVGGRP